MEIISQSKNNNANRNESEKLNIINIQDKKNALKQFQGNATIAENTMVEMKANKAPMKFICRKIENSSEIAFSGPDSSFCSPKLIYLFKSNKSTLPTTQETNSAVASSTHSKSLINPQLINNLSRKPFANNLISKYSAQENYQSTNEDNFDLRKSILLKPRINTQIADNSRKAGPSKERKRATTEYRKTPQELRVKKKVKKGIYRGEEQQKKLKKEEQIVKINELTRAEEYDETNKIDQEKADSKLQKERLKKNYNTDKNDIEIKNKNQIKNKNKKEGSESCSKSYSDEESKSIGFKDSKEEKINMNNMNNRDVKRTSYDSNKRQGNSKANGTQRKDTSHNNEIISIPITQLENLIHYYTLAIQPHEKDKLKDEMGKISLNISFNNDSISKGIHENANGNKIGNNNTIEYSRIDDIIKKNLKKERGARTIENENSKRIEMKKKHREAKARLAKINEEIKTKNALAVQTKNQNNNQLSKQRHATSKEKEVNKSRLMNKSFENRSQKHREMIGMEYVDLTKMSSGRKNPKNHSAIEANENSFNENKIAKKNLNKFMMQKKSKLNKQLKESKDKKKKDQEKKDKNLDKLKHYIKNQRKAGPLKIQKNIPQIKNLKNIKNTKNSEDESDLDDYTKNEKIYREYQAILNDIHEQEKKIRVKQSQRSQTSSPKSPKGKLNSYEERKESLNFSNSNSKAENEVKNVNKVKQFNHTFCTVNQNQNQNLDSLDQVNIVSLENINYSKNNYNNTKKDQIIEEPKVNEDVKEIQVKKINANVNDISISIDKSNLNLNLNHSYISQGERKNDKMKLDKPNLNLSFDVCQDIGKLSINRSFIPHDNSDFEPSKPIISLNELKNLEFFQDRLELNIIGRQIGEKKSSQKKSDLVKNINNNIDSELNEDYSNSFQEEQFQEEESESSNHQCIRDPKNKKETSLENLEKLGKNSNHNLNNNIIPNALKALKEKDQIEGGIPSLNSNSRLQKNQNVGENQFSSKHTNDPSRLENKSNNVSSNIGNSTNLANSTKLNKLNKLNNHNIFETISIIPCTVVKEILPSKNFEIQTEDFNKFNKSNKFDKSLNGNSGSNSNSNSSLKEKPNESSSLSGLRAYFGSETKIREASNDILKHPISPRSSQAVKSFQNEMQKYRSTSERNNSLENLNENNLINIEKSLNRNHKPDFDKGKNSFDTFSLRKFKELLNEDNMSKIILMREKLMKVKAKKEKKLINRKLKNNEYSPKTYFRMHMELEKWVDKEKKEINKSRQELVENWKKTANLINETHQNIIRTRQLLSNKNKNIYTYNNTDNNLKYASAANSERSLGFDSLESKELTLRESKEELFPLQDSIEAYSLKRDKSLGHLKENENENENENSSPDLEEKEINKKINNYNNFNNFNHINKVTKINIENNENNQSAIKVVPDLLLDTSNKISKDDENSINSNQNDLVDFSPINPNLKLENSRISGIFKNEINKVKESKHLIDTNNELLKNKINLNDNLNENLDNHFGTKYKSTNQNQFLKYDPSWNSAMSEEPTRMKKPIEEEFDEPAKLEEIFNNEDNYGIAEKVKGRNNRNLLNNKEEISKPLSIQQKASTISDIIFNELLNELSHNFYPIRSQEEILYSFDIKKEKFGDKNLIPSREINNENTSNDSNNLNNFNNLNSVNNAKNLQNENNNFEQDTIEKKILMQSLNRKNGINTDSASLETLLDHIFSEVSKNSIPFLNKLQMPIPKEFVRILNDLQVSESNLIQQQFLPHELFPILTNQCFIEIQKNNSNYIKPFLQDVGSQSSLLSEIDPKSPEFIKECEFVHNKAVYDSVNECLNLMRPYGLNGEPLPWSSSIRIIQNKLPKIENVFANIKNIIQEWCSIEAGTLPKPEFIINNKFDDEYFAETREKRLGAILSQEIIDNEETWVNYELEETQVKLDVTDMVLDHLVKEVVQIIDTIEINKEKIE